MTVNEWSGNWLWTWWEKWPTAAIILSKSFTKYMDRPYFLPKGLVISVCSPEPSLGMNVAGMAVRTSVMGILHPPFVVRRAAPVDMHDVVPQAG
jgi:hypothetical protein